MRFQWRLLQALARHRSAAEAFGPAWEATLEEIPLDDPDQGPVYWQLIAWARNDHLFRLGTSRDVLHAWKETVHEF